MATDNPRIFISYAVKDGSDAARVLRQRLEFDGFAIWQDVVALEGGRDWWSQIEDAIRAKSVEHLVLVVSPEALTRPIVRREIRLAKTLGKQVTPVQSGPELNIGSLPRWLGHVLDPSKPEHWAQLLKTVAGPSKQARMPMMAPEPPADFVARPREFKAIKRQLLDTKGDAAVGITAALRGAGGYGKTTLAKALAHDPAIQEAYFDGVLWVELGEQGIGRVVALISDLVTLITGKPPAIATREAAATALAEALGDRRFLLVIDDVWQRAALDPFLQGGTSTTRLVTTRFDRELPEAAARQAVDAMAQNEALALLSWGLPPSDVRLTVRELQGLSAKLGEWAQLLKLVNGFLRDRVVKHSQGLATAIADVTRRLDARGMAAFDDKRAKDYDARHRSVTAVINTTLELLDKDQRARFGELGIFPEDADIPIGIVARLWRETGSIDEIETEDLLHELYDLSLLLSLDFDSHTLRFHDTTRHFLQYQAGQEALVAQHKRLLCAIDDMGGAEETDPRSRRYFYEYLPEHLAGAGELDMLDSLLLDPGWLRDKLAATRSPLSLVADFEQHGRGRMQDFIGRTLRLIPGICTRDERQLLPQLVGRLMSCVDPAAPAFVDRARFLIEPPALIPLRPGLTPPGAETARFEGHTDNVNALVVLLDGRLASASDDNTIRLWDVKSGAESTRLEGHHGKVYALTVLPDGRLASGSGDSTVRLWDVKSGTETARIEGMHFDPFSKALAVLPDGRLASGSGDNTIRLWDLKSGTETGRLEGHTGRVNALAVLPDGRLASGSGDSTVRLWDVRSGAETGRLEGHAKSVTALTMLPDGRLATAAEDSKVRLWDVGSGAETAHLESTSIGWVTALAALPDGSLASGSGDRLIRLWDSSSGGLIAKLEGHTGFVTALTMLPDGRLASSGDKTVRLWDINSGAESTSIEVNSLGQIHTLVMLPDGRLASGSQDSAVRLWNVKTGVETARFEGPPKSVTALAVLPDGRLAAGSGDKTVRLWDVTTGSETARLLGHTDWVRALMMLPDGRLASGSWDKTVRVWNVRSGAETVRLVGHTGQVEALALLPDGRLASAAWDSSVRLWNVNSGAETARLEHADYVSALAVLPDGQLASGSADNTIRLWDVRTGAETGRLEGHTDWVRMLTVLPDGRLVSGSEDHTIRLWDLKSGAETCRLDVDSAVSCVIPLSDGILIAGDEIGHLHWLEILDSIRSPRRIRSH